MSLFRRNFDEYRRYPPLNHRSWILYELRQGLSAYEAHRKRMIEASRPRTLSDMPIDVLGKILKIATWREITSLRQVCRKIRETVDKIEISYREAHILVSDFCTILSINGECRLYKRQQFNDPLTDDDWDVMHRENLLRAFHELDVMMKHPKLHFEHLIVDFSSDCEDHIESFNKIMRWDRILPTLKRFDLRIETARIRSHFSEAAYVLECLDPDFLKRIELENFCGGAAHLMESEQWNGAKELKITGFKRQFRMEDLAHFVCFDVEVRSVNLKEVLQLIKNVLRKSPTFEKCHLKWLTDKDRLDTETVEKSFGEYTRIHPKDLFARHYLVKENGGKKTFAINIGPKSIEVLKRK